MCTSVIFNGRKTLVGWNLDILDMEHRVRPCDQGVYIEINDPKEGWMPLFGANCRGDFVTMPTCWPYDQKSDFVPGAMNIINLNMDLLMQKRTFEQTKKLVENTQICSVPGLTFQAQLSDRAGNVLRITPGQGHTYLERPKYAVMTNFSPYKGDREKHPWMGLDRYQTALKLLEEANETFDVGDCFAVLKASSQTVCPTVVSMVYDAQQNKAFWCENREWQNISCQQFKNNETAMGQACGSLQQELNGADTR